MACEQYNQTLFLGLTVVSFDCSIGWSNQGSQLTVTLVEDPCDGTKVYYDGFMNQQTWSGPDPGLSYADIPNGVQSGFNVLSVPVKMFPPVVGTPLYFRFADFEYAGICQGYHISVDTNGNPLYSVVLSDPRQLLEDTHIITGRYNGSVGSTFNILNVYGLMETLGGSLLSCNNFCYPGSIWSSVPGYPSSNIFAKYGGAEYNSRGMPWDLVKRGIQSLTAKTVTLFEDLYSEFCNSNRLQFRGDSYVYDGQLYSRLGMGHLPVDPRPLSPYEFYTPYLIDISEVPDRSYLGDIPVRIGAEGNISVMEAIDTVCSEMGIDYYVELIPTYGPGNFIYNMIKVRIVQKFDTYDLGRISQFVSENEGRVKSHSYGVELRNEPCSAFIVGGPRRDMIERLSTGTESSTDPIRAYWGLDSNNNIIFGTGTDDDHTFTLDTSSLGIGINTHEVTVAELRAALVSQDLWSSVIASQGHASATALGITGKWGMAAGALADFAAGNVAKLDMNAFLLADKDAADFLQDTQSIMYAQMLYNYIRQFADQFYGRQFAVAIPQTCFKYEPGEITFTESHEPSPEGGWPLYNLNTLDGGKSSIQPLTLSELGLFLFRNEDGLVNSFIKLNSTKTAALDYSRLSPMDFYIENNCAYIRVNIEPRIAYTNYATKCGPYIIITLPSPLPVIYTSLTDGTGAPYGGLVSVLANLTGNSRNTVANSLSSVYYSQGQGRLMLTVGAGPLYMKPDAAAVAVKSNIQTYGPWSSRSTAICDLIPDGIPDTILAGNTIPPAGRVLFEMDDDMVPWNFGSELNLGCFAALKARDSINMKQDDELGDCVLAGLWDKPLGHELLAPIPFIGTARQLSPVLDTTTNTTFYALPMYANTGNGDTIFSTTNPFQGWQGYYGPNITDINVSVSPTEITTVYRFRTHTEARNRFAKYNIERFRRITRNQIAFGRALVQNGRQGAFSIVGGGYAGLGISYLPAAGIGRSTAGFFNINDPIGGKKTAAGAFSDSPSKPSTVIAGGGQKHTDSGFTWVSPHVQESHSSDSLIEMDQAQGHALAGLETILRPFAVGLEGTPTDDVLPKFKYTESATSRPSPGAPPNTTMSAASLNQTSYTLNPFLHPNGHGLDPSADANRGGHDMVYLSSSTTLSGTAQNTTFKPSLGNDDMDYTAAVYRGFGLRGPVVIAGWGYDLDGFPVPNASGDGGTATTFATNYLRRMDQWKVGPLDVRWDEERGVWTSWPGYRLVVATLDEDMLVAEGPYSATVVPNAQIGGTNAEGTIEITNVFGHPIGQGTKVLAYYDPPRDTYIVLRAEHKEVCVVTRVDCSTNLDGVSSLTVCDRRLFLDSAWSTENCVDDDPNAYGDTSSECGGSELDFDTGSSPYDPGPATPLVRGYVGYRASDFGATADGSTDDTSASQDLLDFVAALGNGSTAFFGAGTYKLSRSSALGANNYALIVPGSDISIAGEGPSTVFMLDSGTVASVFTTPVASTLNNIVFRDIVVDANASQVPWGYDNYAEVSGAISNFGNTVAGVQSQHGICLNNVDNGLIHNVKIQNVGMDGLRINNCNNIIGNNLTITNTGNHNIHILGSTSVRINTARLENANYSPDDGATKDYYYSTQGYSAVHITDLPSSSPTDSIFNKISLSNLDIKTTTGRCLSGFNSATDIVVNNVLIESNTRRNTIINGRTTVDFQNCRSVRVNNVASRNMDRFHTTAYSLFVSGCDYFSAHHVEFSGGASNIIYGSNGFVVDEAKFVNTSGNFAGAAALSVIGTNTSSVHSFSIDNVKIFGHKGDIGVRLKYCQDGQVGSVLGRGITSWPSGTTRGLVSVANVSGLRVNLTTCMDGVGINASGGNINNCIFGDNIALDHILPPQIRNTSRCHDNIPGIYNSSTASVMGLTNQQVLFGAADGTIAQDSDFYFNTTTNRLYSYSLETSGVLIDNGDVRLQVIGRGFIGKSPDGQYWKITINNKGSIVTSPVA